jgi:hypothetical protein
MHPPAFSAEQRLSDWPKCFIEMRCSHCAGRSAVFPVWRMMQLYGDRTFGEMLKALKCERCGGSPAPVFLCASAHRQWSRGPRPDWAVELVPEPESKPGGESNHAVILPYAKKVTAS